MSRFSASSAAAAAALALVVNLSQGHIMQKYPISRPVLNGPSYRAWDDPEIEYCAHCYNARGPKFVKQRAHRETDKKTLNDFGGGDEFPLYFGEYAKNGNYLETNEIAKRHGVCGDPEQFDDEGSNVYSTPNSKWKPQETFKSGDVIEINTVVNAYHWGHVEFFLCNADEMDDPDGVPTQECFNKYPLDRASDDGDASPIDPKYYGRYYLDPECRAKYTDQESNEVEGYNVKMRYVLPDIECEHCIMQMVYYTGNTCKHVGYEDFNPDWSSYACATGKSSWIELDRYVCGTEGQYPEQFWACSDFALQRDGPAPGPTRKEPSPTPEPVTPKPVPATPQNEENDDGMGMYEYIGCFTDDTEDRVLQDQLDDPKMTTEMCYKHCSVKGAKFMATQYAHECFCSEEENLDYTRHDDSDDEGKPECDLSCKGNNAEVCGGKFAFSLYSISSMDEESAGKDSAGSDAAGSCAGVWGQCGGKSWSGSTCCSDHLKCEEMNEWFHQCIPN